MKFLRWLWSEDGLGGILQAIMIGIGGAFVALWIICLIGMWFVPKGQSMADAWGLYLSIIGVCVFLMVTCIMMRYYYRTNGGITIERSSFYS